jgi:hypothetical protein
MDGGKKMKKFFKCAERLRTWSITLQKISEILAAE